MKTLQTTKCLLAASLIALLAGCEEDYSPEQKTANVAPTHSGDLTLTMNEGDIVTKATVNLLEGVVDTDGDYVTIANLTASSDNTVGVMHEPTRISFDTTAIADDLDSGQVHTIAYTYDISDGTESVQRKLTINVNGLDHAPTINGDLSANFLKSADGIVDLLAGTADLDGEALSAHSVVADAGNPFDINFTVSDDFKIDFDFAAVSDSFPSGKLSTFKYSYKVSDHNHDLTRNLEINVLGVVDVLGAPVVTEYFTTASINEDGGVQTFDLAKDATDREGDPIQVTNVMVDGKPLPYNMALNGTQLSVDPAAYYHLQPGEQQNTVVSYKLQDDGGKTADGTLELTLTITGTDMNLLSQAGLASDFDDDSDPVTQTNGFVTLVGCPNGVGVNNVDSISPNYSFQILGGLNCMQRIEAQYWPDMADNEQYYMSYWIKTAGVSPWVGLSDTITNPPSATLAFWDQGFRPDLTPNDGVIKKEDVGDDTWQHITIQYDTTTGVAKRFIDAGIADKTSFYIASSWVAPTGTPLFDNLKLVKYNDKKGPDALLGSGAFDSAAVPTITGGGTVSITNDTLIVNTTGATAGTPVVVSLPVASGAVKANGRYVLELDIQYVNFDANKATDGTTTAAGSYPVIASLSTNAGAVSFSNSQLPQNAWQGGVNNIEIVLSEVQHTLGQGTVTDWSADDVMLNLEFDFIGAEFKIDNVTLKAIP
ncbi:Ig-like domain-containing protein [Saccharobesus litoralis]|nr:cadherin-like domain-containing protein [Saccharobesus litoralis]